MEWNGYKIKDQHEEQHLKQSLEELNDSVSVFTNSSLTSNTKFVHYQVQDGGHHMVQL